MTSWSWEDAIAEENFMAVACIYTLLPDNYIPVSDCYQEALVIDWLSLITWLGWGYGMGQAAGTGTGWASVKNCK